MGDKEVSQYRDVKSDTSERAELNIAGIFPGKTNTGELALSRSEVFEVYLGYLYPHVH